jgi:electron transfer flavoprotein beta subunit
MNPFDEIAVEEAVRLKEQGIVKEIVAVSMGPMSCQETLRIALALGADQAIHILTEEELQPLTVAKVAAELVKIHQPDLVLLGKQAIDDDCNQTGQMLAAILNWSQATFASKLIIENSQAIVTREIDGGLETLKVKLPVVVTTDLRLNEPRYLSLPNIMKSKKIPILTQALTQMRVDVSSGLQTLKVTPPPVKTPGIRVNNVQELIAKLHDEAKVL